MVKSDQLYQLDLRLREITQKPTKLFGGVSIFCFGNLLQLQPCRAAYIFEEPKCEAYKLAYDCETHWKSFEVITLEENHRQEGDYEYANILNRLESISMNKNQTNWEKENSTQLRLSFLNCHSLADKFSDIVADPIILKSHIISLSETWLMPDSNQEKYCLDNFNLKLNSLIA